MNASTTMEVATTTVKTQMEITLVPATMATNLTVMDMHVMVKINLKNYKVVTSNDQIQFGNCP